MRTKRRPSLKQPEQKSNLSNPFENSHFLCENYSTIEFVDSIVLRSLKETANEAKTKLEGAGAKVELK